MVIIPSTVLFVAFDAILNPYQISIADCDSCPEFNRWQYLRVSGMAVDFRRILRIDSELGDLNDYLIKDSILGVFDQLSTEIYRRCEDCSSMIVKTISGVKSMKSLRLLIEKQLNLSHPCILAPIGFIFQTNSTMSTEFKIVELYLEENSLSEVISSNPVWWTATAKAKAIAGIVLGLRFAHSFGLIHGHLNAKNIVFDVDHRIQITDFYPICLEVDEREQVTDVLSDEKWSPDQDVRGFASILFEIIVGHPVILSDAANDEAISLSDIPVFVSELIASGRSRECRIGQSFNDIFDILKTNEFKIMSGVDSVDVLAFVDWVKSFE
jgi:serine/threonine protein kinase